MAIIRCPKCHRELRPNDVQNVLHGKYRFHPACPHCRQVFPDLIARQPTVLQRQVAREAARKRSRPHTFRLDWDRWAR